MIRPLQKSDIPEVLAMLQWMDEQPEREVFAPLSRDIEELQLEWQCEQSQCWVLADQQGHVSAYCAIAPFKDGLVLEGPLSQFQLALPSQQHQQGEDAVELLQASVVSLLTKVLELAEGLPVYAFCAAANASVCQVIESAGLTPMHLTEFFSAPLTKLKLTDCPEGLDYDGPLEIVEYRDLYRASEASWSERLEWTPEQYDEHFQREDITFLSLRRHGRSVGFIEAELQYTEGRAEVSYLCVHPADRGQGLGHVLISLMVAELAALPEITSLRLRAHDHAHEARALYHKIGLKSCRSMLTYMQEGEEEA